MSRGGAGAQEPGGRASPGKPRALRSSSSRSSDGPKSGRPPWCLQHLHAVPGTTNSRVEGESAPEGERARAERGMRGRRPRRGRRSGGPRCGGRRRRARAGPSAEPGKCRAAPGAGTSGAGRAGSGAGIGARDFGILLVAGGPGVRSEDSSGLVEEARAPRDLHGARAGPQSPRLSRLLGSHASPPAVCCQLWEKLAGMGGAGSAPDPGGKDGGERQDPKVRERHL